eukprot:1227728-Pleurochrysis_carterae.AAC.2
MCSSKALSASLLLQRCAAPADVCAARAGGPSARGALGPGHPMAGGAGMGRSGGWQCQNPPMVYRGGRPLGEPPRLQRHFSDQPCAGATRARARARSLHGRSRTGSCSLAHNSCFVMGFMHAVCGSL